MTDSLAFLRPARLTLFNLPALLMLVVAISCAGFAAKGEAEAAVANFHQMLDAERYALTYDTEFAEGHATESFNWRVSGGKVHLAGYNIKSPLLITR
jgi:hypothetical protein